MSTNRLLIESVSFFSSHIARLDSFGYVGRKSFGALRIAISILILGFFIGALSGPGRDDVTSSKQTAMSSDKMGTRSPNKPKQTNESAPTPTSTNVTELNNADNKKRILSVKNGDTLMSIMLAAGIGRYEAHEAINALRVVYDPRGLRVGQRIELSFSSDDKLEEMSLDASAMRRVAVRRHSSNIFNAIEIKRDLTRKVSYAMGTINSNLYKAAIGQEVPMSVLAELVRIYSWDVDFQREIQKGDSFEVAYERFVDLNGEIVQYGKVIFARMTLSGAIKPLYEFELRPGRTDYFDDKGGSAKRPLLRTPIDGARLSSGFGKRRHPILGYTKIHRGVDFSAPTGTPIYAAGDGVITFRGRKGAYGKYIRIKHAAGYSTAYAHLSRYKKGVTQGRRVKQGEVIGYVGSTGRSTGPHLHYEILVGGRQTNPLTIKMPSGITLKGPDLARFQIKTANISALVSELKLKSSGGKQPETTER